MRRANLVSRGRRRAVALVLVLALGAAPLQAAWVDGSGNLPRGDVSWGVIIGVAAAVVGVSYLLKRKGPPAAQLSIAGPDFDAVPVGETTESRVMLTNTAPAPVEVSRVTIDGRQFAVAWDGSPIRLNPGETAELPVTFTPAKNGRAKASLRIFADGEDLKEKNFKVSLRANGV